jgi:hypothetical protein
MIVPLDHRAVEVTFTRTTLCVELSDGRQIVTPLEWFPALDLAAASRREHWEIHEDGNLLVWPYLGERITVAFLLSLRAGTIVLHRSDDLFPETRR